MIEEDNTKPLTENENNSELGIPTEPLDPSEILNPEVSDSNEPDRIEKQEVYAVSEPIAIEDTSIEQHHHPIQEILISESVVRLIGKAVNQRIKIMNVLAVYFDEFVENENVIYKALSKLAPQASFGNIKIEWFHGFVQILDEFYKTIIVTRAKSHQLFAQQITANISKLFKEIYKSYPQSTSQKLTYLVSLLEELKRAKTAHGKNFAHYQKVIVNTEKELKAWENLIAANEALAATNANNNPPAPLLRNNSGTHEIESANPQSANTIPAKEDNRFTFSKMLSKRNPPEKKLEDKCREYFKELEIIEKQLAVNADSLNHYRSELISTAQKTIQELFEAEFGRLTAMKDGLLAFAAGYEVHVSGLFDTLGLLSTKFSSLLSEPHNANLSAYLTGVSTLIEHPALNFISNSAEVTENFQAEKSEINVLFLRIGRLTDTYETLFGTSQKALQLLDDVNDVEKNYSKAIQTIFEKNGFQKMPVESSVYSNAGSKGVLYSSGCCGVLVQTLELPAMKKTLENYIIGVGRLTEIIQKTLDSLSDEVSEQFVSLHRKLANTKKDLIDKTISQIRKLENVFVQLSKSRSELKKLKTLLKERRQTVKLARDEISEGNPTQFSDIIASTRDSERDSEGPGSKSSLSGLNNNSIASAPLSEVAFERQPSVTLHQHEEEESSSTSIIDPLEASAGRRQSSLLSAVKLKQAVGFESASDRVTRIEHQISGLEDKEVELTAKCDSLFKSLTSEISTTKHELESCFSAHTDSLIGLVYEFKTVMDIISKLQLQKFQSFRDNIRSMKDNIIDFPIQEDINSAKKAFSTAEFDFIAQSTELLEIPAAESFKPIISQAVIEGKAKILHQQHPALLQAVNELTQEKEKEKEKEKQREKLRELEKHMNSTTAPPALESIKEKDGNEQEREAEETPLSASNNNNEANDNNPASPQKPPQIISPPPTSPDSRLLQEMKDENAGLLISREKSASTAEKLEIDVDSVTDVNKTSTSNKNNNNNNTNNSSVNNSTKESGGDIFSPGLNDAVFDRIGQSSRKSRTASGGAASSDFELKKFGLSIHDKILESFSCALYPKKGILTHGRMYITQHFVAFSGWPDTRVLLSMKRIETILKSNTLMYIPNAITIILADKTEFFFASFIDRDLCWNLLVNLVQVEKRICELAGPDGIPDNPNLMFGYQHRSTLISSNTLDANGNEIIVDENTENDNSEEFATNTDQNAGEIAKDSEETANQAQKIRGLSVDQPQSAAEPKDIDPFSPDSVLDSASSPSKSNTPIPPGSPMPPSKNNSLPESPSTVASSVAATPSVPPPFSLPPAVVPITVEKEKEKVKEKPKRNKNPQAAPKFDSFFKNSGLTPITKKTLKGTTADMWSSFWRHSSSFKEFLTASGDVPKSYSEWSYVNALVPEDLTKTRFHYERDFDYDHQRTTMLMFGPKMAPTKLKQLIYLYSEEEFNDNEMIRMELTEPKMMVVLNLSFCEGVPMADIFKVLQYWTFATTDNGKECEVSVGLGLHYLKYSLMKSQIFNGTRDEMNGQLEFWMNYVPKVLEKAAIKRRTLMEGGGGGQGRDSHSFTIHEKEGKEIISSEAPVTVIEGNDKDIVIISTANDDHDSTVRKSRRLSVGNKSVTITTNEDVLSDNRSPRRSTGLESFTIYGFEVRTIVLAALCFFLFMQMMMIRSLASEISLLRQVILEMKDNHKL